MYSAKCQISLRTIWWCTAFPLVVIRAGSWRNSTMATATARPRGASASTPRAGEDDGEEYWYALGQPDFEILGL